MSEIDFESEWRIPAEKMKMREQHIVPLCTQAITILQELKAFTGEENMFFQVFGQPNGRCLKTLF